MINNDSTRYLLLCVVVAGLWQISWPIYLYVSLSFHTIYFPFFPRKLRKCGKRITVIWPSVGRNLKFVSMFKFIYCTLFMQTKTFMYTDSFSPRSRLFFVQHTLAYITFTKLSKISNFHTITFCSPKHKWLYPEVLHVYNYISNYLHNYLYIKRV